MINYLLPLYFILFAFGNARADYFLLNRDLVIIRYVPDQMIEELIPRYLVQWEVHKEFSPYYPHIIFGVTKAVLDKTGKVVGYHTDDKRYQTYTQNKCKKAVEGL